MSVVRRAPGRALVAGVLVVCLASAHGDVTLEQTLRVEGTGVMKLINMSGTTMTVISGDRARTESDVNMESRVMRMFGGGPAAEIVRLDDEKVYQLNLKKKTYTETTFEAQRAAMRESIERMREAQQQQQQGASGIDESQCEWSEPTATVDRTGESDSIAGYRAERVTVTATQSCADPKTDQVCRFNLVLDQWLAPEFEPGQEAADYYRSYAQKLGLDVAQSAAFAQRLESMFGSYGGIWSEIAARMQDTEGYPLRASVALAVGGPQCEAAPAASAESTRPGVGEAVGGAIGGALGGFLGRRKDAADRARAEPAAEAHPAMMPDGTIRLMSISTELVSVRQDAADPGLFEVPANFRPARD